MISIKQDVSYAMTNVSISHKCHLNLDSIKSVNLESSCIIYYGISLIGLVPYFYYLNYYVFILWLLLMSKLNYSITCLICKDLFNSKRIDSKTCSSKCRYKLYTLRKNDRLGIIQDSNYHYHNDKTYRLISIRINDPINLRIKNGLCIYCGYQSSPVLAAIRNNIIKSS